MKKLTKKLSFALIFVLILGVSFGCNNDEDPISETRISSENKVPTDDLALLASFNFDIDNNGSEEKIAMYVEAEQGPDGEIYWDDRQNWLFLVEGEEVDYVLFNDYIQIGYLDFYVYTENDDFYITTIQSATANLKVTNYKFDFDSSEFISSIEYQTKGNVNMLYSTSSY